MCHTSAAVGWISSFCGALLGSGMHSPPGAFKSGYSFRALFPQGMEDPAGTPGARTCGKCRCTTCNQKFFSQRVLPVLVVHPTVPQALSMTQAVLFPSAAPWTCEYVSHMLVTREMTGNSWKIKPKNDVGETNLSQAAKSLMVPTTAFCRLRASRCSYHTFLSDMLLLQEKNQNFLQNQNFPPKLRWRLWGLVLPIQSLTIVPC